LKRFIYTLVFVLTASAAVFAQSIGGSEFLEARTNASVFVSGETLFYSIRCSDNSGRTSDFSRVAYADLVSSDGKIVSSQKVFLENGKADGDFFISPSLPTASYKLVAYTRWMKDSPANELCQVDLAVINPFSALSPNLVGATGTVSQAQPTSLTLSKTNYSERSRVELTLPSNVIGKGNYSVSVNRKDALSQLVSGSQKSTAVFSNKAPLAELRGELISGTVRDQAGNAVTDNKISVSAPGKNPVVKVSQTDRNGRFYVTLENPVVSGGLIVQALGENRENLTVSVDQDFHPDYSALKFAPLVITPELEDDIRRRSVSSQVENAYFSKKKDVALASSDTLPFFAPSGKIFNLDDYTRFKTLKETFVEVLENASATQTNGKYEIRIRDYRPNSDFEGSPMILADGVFLEDPTELFDFPADEIESITIIQGLYLYGPATYDGVVSINTKKGNYRLKRRGTSVLMPELLRPNPKKKYYKPDYSASSDSRIPDYRSQLLWLPDAIEPRISFYTSDVPGTYEIRLQGSDNDGTPVLMTANFEVARQP